MSSFSSKVRRFRDTLTLELSDFFLLFELILDILLNFEKFASIPVDEFFTLYAMFTFLRNIVRNNYKAD